MQGPTFLRSKFFWAQISRGPNFLGTKKVRGPNEIGDHFSYSLTFGSSTLSLSSLQSHNFDLTLLNGIYDIHLMTLHMDQLERF